MRATLIASAIAVVLAAGNAAAQDATTTTTTTTTTKHHHHKVARRNVVTTTTVAGPNVQAELAQRDQEIAELKSALADVQAKVGELEQRTDAQSDVNVQTAKTVEDLQVSAKKTDKIEKIVNDTSVGGRLFIDMTDVSQKTTSIKNPSLPAVHSSKDGYGLDVTRGYLTVSHNFNDVWSALLTTDFNYLTGAAETQVFIKKAYLQGKFSDAFVFRAGEADMPWVPYVENLYGYRYVDKVLIDRQGFGVSTDWGLNANGKIDSGLFDYSASVVNGGGFKIPSRSKRMDFEGRLGFTPVDNLSIAVGGYSGTLGQDFENANGTDTANHTASRGDAMIAYAKGNTRFGAEYFEASDWKQVAALPNVKDKADGYSLWGSFGFADKFAVFGRYDNTKSSQDLDPGKRDKFFDLGFQWDVRKGVKLALVYKNDDLRDPLADTDTKNEEFGVFGDVSF